jgi:hypothetical protein
MFLAFLTMLTALTISGVAIYYSVAGLAAIFAAAVIPIIIMGGVLEIAKLVTAVWLHKYWSRAVWWLKAYLSTAVLVLMFITSMGIFGFLSKAHIEQTSLSIEQTAQASQLEDNIIRAESKITRWDDETNRLLSGEDIRVDSLVEREQQEIDKLYNRLEKEKAQARQDAQSNIDLQNNRLSQAQTRKEQDIANAQQRYAGTFANKDALDEAIQKATQNELSVASAVQRQIVSINNNLIKQVTAIDDKYSPQIAEFQDRINELRNQSNNETQDIDARLDELEYLIKQEQTSIADLREKRALVERQYRQLEAEVGPIKYIAEFVYGEEANKNLLEEAVRWVIIIIILVFDPLAVLLLIASQYTFQWKLDNRDNRKESKQSGDDTADAEESSDTVDPDEESNEDAKGQDTSERTVDIIEDHLGQPSSVVSEIPSAVDDAAYVVAESYAQKKRETEQERLESYEQKELNANWQIAKKDWKESHPNETLKEYKRKYILGLIDSLPWEENEYVQNEEQDEHSLWQQLKKDRD